MRANWMRDAAVVAVAGFTISACGGGGDGGSKKPTLSVAQSALSISAATGDVPQYRSLTVSIANQGNTGFYYRASDQHTALKETRLDWNSSPVNGTLQGSLSLLPYPAGLMGAGTYTDSVKIEVCEDSECAKHISGSPRTVSVTYTVTGDAASDASVIISQTPVSVERATNEAAITAQVPFSISPLPPFDVYFRGSLHSRQVVTGLELVDSDFNGYSDYATGKLQLQFALPRQLAAGFFNDELSMSVCFDQACTKLARGGPWVIPLSYSVTASLERDFEHRFVAMNAVDLVADSSGQSLFALLQESGQPQYTYRLVKLDPASGGIVASVDLETRPTKTVVSADGQYLYVGIPEQFFPAVHAHVKRIRAADMAIEATIEVPRGSSSLGSEIWDVQVSPVAPLTFAVGYTYSGDMAASTLRVSIFDGATVRPDPLIVDTRYSYVTNNLQWNADGTVLYVRDWDVSSVAVSASGLGSPVRLSGVAVASGFSYTPFYFAGGILYAQDGGVLDPATATLLGRYRLTTPIENAYFGNRAQLLIDVPANRTLAVYSERGGTLHAFDRTGFTSLWAARLGVSGQPVRWNGDGLAVIGLDAGNTQGIYFLKINLAAAETPVSATAQAVSVSGQIVPSMPGRAKITASRLRWR